MAAVRGHPVTGQRPGLLAGRLTVVTGGGSGLGAAIAAGLAAAGAAGILIDQVFHAGAPVPPGGTSVVADVTDPAAQESAFDQLGGPPQVVVACAGVVPPWTNMADLDAGRWEDVFAVNVRGVMLTIREAVRRLGDRGGSIVAISSLNGWKGDPHLPSYTASKHAVVGLVRSAALDVGQYGIRVNAVAPGPIATAALRGRMAARAGQLGLSVEDALRQAASQTALRRIATESEVAAAVLFLASDMSSGITGQLLSVDAGLA